MRNHRQKDLLNLAYWACYEIGQHRDKNVFRKMLFSFIRFVLLMFGWTKNRYFTSNL